ncbi:MAG: DUF3866 family protein [Acidimicrobiia bacterium]
MPRFVTLAVTESISERPGLQRVALEDGSRAYVLTELIGPVAVGDRVVVNTTAVDLGLGTGGWHVVHWNLARDDWHAPGRGHVLKLRYTSLQADVGVAEETAGDLPGLLGTPVVVCDLHSQVGVVAAAYAATAPGRRLVYVMTDSAALPLPLSDLVAGLRDRGLLAATVTAGQAFGGDHEAVNVHTALLVAAGRAKADAIVVGPGPGAVGTGTALGFGSLDAVTTIEAATRLSGTPIVAVRWSGADERERHRGLSHHTATVLAFTPWPVWVAHPLGEAVPEDLQPERHRMGPVPVPDLDIDVDTMGRTASDDPDFFRWTAAAGVFAARVVRDDG